MTRRERNDAYHSRKRIASLAREAAYIKRRREESLGSHNFSPREIMEQYTGGYWSRYKRKLAAAAGSVAKRAAKSAFGYNYCGPGDNTPGVVPSDAVDAVCQEHDNDYDALINLDLDPYWVWNEADEKMMASMPSGSFTFGQAAVETLMGAKRWLQPHVTLVPPLSQLSDETKQNVLAGKYIMAYGGRRKRFRSRRRPSRRATKRKAAPGSYRRTRFRRGRARKTRFSRRKAPLTKKSILRMLNPPQTYSIEGVKFVNGGISAKNWLPIVCGEISSACSSITGMMKGYSFMGGAVSAIFGSSATLGSEFWFLHDMISYEMTNSSNAIMNLKLVHLRCKQNCDAVGPIEISYNQLDQSFNEASPAADTTEMSANPWNGGTAGSVNYTSVMWFDPFSDTVSKRAWSPYFKVVKARHLVLKPNQTIKFAIKIRKPHLFKYDTFLAGESASNANVNRASHLQKGTEFVSVGFWGNLTVGENSSNGAATNPEYAKTCLVMRVLHTCRLVNRTENAAYRYQGSTVGTYEGTYPGAQYGANALVSSTYGTTYPTPTIQS